MVCFDLTVLFCFFVLCYFVSFCTIFRDALNIYTVKTLFKFFLFKKTLFKVLLDKVLNNIGQVVLL